MAFPEFRHIHCSSRFDRSAESLESAVDQWRTSADLITLTEVNSDRRAATLAEVGWGYFNAKKDNGSDESAVCWDKDLWTLQNHWLRKLNTHQLDVGRKYVWSCSVMLKRRATGHRLLITTAHLPAHVDSFSHAPPQDTQAYWLARKKIYQECGQHWSAHVKDLANKTRPDAAMVVGDWNINLKLDWARDWLHDRFDKYQLAWKLFPMDGGSLGGGPVAPLGAPGKGTSDRIIDGTLYRGLKVSEPPNLMARTASSDHRPYKESFQFNNAAGKGFLDGKVEPTHGNTKPGDEWWGFGDYLDDEIYALTRATGEAGGEVL